jgi:spore coat polysaccharide biosynthesis predicted glycosyltransferase SpsG
MQERPELVEINRHVHQRGLIDLGPKVLFVIDAGGPFGLGHLMRSQELARQLAERKGWATVFAVDDESAATLLRQQGSRVVWAAFARQTNLCPKGSHHKVEDILGDYDLLVLDIYDQRGPTSGWREKLGTSLPIVVIDNRKAWSTEADLVITPGVTAADDEDNLFGTPHLSGVDYLILRREIWQAASSTGSKDLDLLVYLHRQAEREVVADFAACHNLNVEILDSFTPELPSLMARARLYISGFGISFYEALVLRTLPICWPDSAAHRSDALRFFKRLEMTPQIISADSDLDAQLLPLLREPVAEMMSALQDGTPAIVTALDDLLKKGFQPFSQGRGGNGASHCPGDLWP